MVKFLFTFIILFNINLSFAQGLEMISSDKFLAENPSVEREAIINFITHQFDMYKEVSITQADLDNLWHNTDIRNALYMARFQIIDQKLYADSFDINNFRFYEMYLYLDKLSKKYKINDVDFIMYMRDEIPEEHSFKNKVLDVPAFMMSKDINYQHEKNKFLFPDTYMIIDNWKILSEKITKANQENLWNNKSNILFWRGATTGGIYNINNFSKLPRLSLSILSKLYPDLIDAKFSNYAQISDDKQGHDLQKILDLLELKSNDRVDEVDHLKYKYLISIDGNNCTWGRPVWIMLSNSVLVKQETPKIQWFYSAIKPYVHYVPVKEDLTDISQQIEWMKIHDTELEKVSQNAQNFVKNNLMPEHIEAQTVIILNEYSKLFKKQKLEATLQSLKN